jgi:thiamine biosynthesis protein ThiS
MNVILNGSPRELPESCRTVADLVALVFPGLPVLVERNGQALFPREFASTPVQEGDRFEILRMVAGG